MLEIFYLQRKRSVYNMYRNSDTELPSCYYLVYGESMFACFLFAF